MNIKMGYLFQYLNFEKIAQIISSSTTLSSKSSTSNNMSNSFNSNNNPLKNKQTISSSGMRPSRMDAQPLHNISESNDIDMPKDTRSMSSFKNTQSTLSHLKDNHLLSMPKTFKSR
jgi:hypothetical protein